MSGSNQDLASDKTEKASPAIAERSPRKLAVGDETEKEKIKDFVSKKIR